MKIRWISIDPFLQKMILRQKDNPRGIRPNPPSSTPSLLPDKVSFLPLIVIIVIARQKLAYGRQGLAGSWGQDTDQTDTFWGILNHEKPTWNLKNPQKNDLKP